MKLNELTPEDFVLRPPAQLLWVKRHYCRLFESSIALSEEQRVELDAFNKRRSRFFTTRVGLYRHKRAINVSGIKRNGLLGGYLEEDEPYMNFIINILGTEEIFMGSCAIDESMYLLPYLFASNPCVQVVNGKQDGKMWIDQLLPDRWEKMRRMNMVDDFEKVARKANNWRLISGKVEIDIVPYESFRHSR